MVWAFGVVTVRVEGSVAEGVQGDQGAHDGVFSHPYFHGHFTPVLYPVYMRFIPVLYAFIPRFWGVKGVNAWGERR